MHAQERIDRQAHCLVHSQYEPMQLTIIAVTSHNFCHLDQNSNKGDVKVTVELGGLDVEYPGIDPNLCNFVKCPLESGKTYETKVDVVTSTVFPSMVTNIKIIGEGDNGQLFCGFAKIGLVD